MLRSCAFKYSLVLLLSVPCFTHTNNPLETLIDDTEATWTDKAFLAAFVYQCEKQNANPIATQVNAPEWNTSFTSTVGGIDLDTRVLRLVGLSDDEKTVIITSSTTFTSQDTEPSDVQRLLVHQAAHPNKQALTQCTAQKSDNGSTITCTAIYEIKKLKATLASFGVQTRKKKFDANKD